MGIFAGTRTHTHVDPYLSTCTHGYLCHLPAGVSIPPSFTTRFRADSALTTEYNKHTRTGNPVDQWPKFLVSDFALSQARCLTTNEQAVTPPEFPSPTFENMDLTSDDTKTWLAEIEIKLSDQQIQDAQMLDALNNTLQLLVSELLMEQPWQLD